MFTKSKFGVPQFYPRDLKKRVDNYVIGQDRAKKTICSTIFNHYQRLRRKYHHEDSDRLLREKLQRQRFARDRDLHERNREQHNNSMGYDDDYNFEEDMPYKPPDPSESFYRPEDTSIPQHVKIDKSNILLIGPTGVGKTYILETLSKKLNVPFTISDCNSFTQAGYIGQDVEACIERLLIEANYDVAAAEYGIIVLDEFDKIARRETSHGRDVGGEGVQQALLKLVEGTRVTVNVKDTRSASPSSSSTIPSSSSRSASPITSTYGSPSGPSSPSGSSPTQSSPSPGKADQYTVDTSNILFVFTGAFVGLDNHILRRVARPSMGFGSEIRSSKGASLSGSKAVLPASAYAHLPHQPSTSGSPTGFTPLDLATPLDLQAFGFIPELIGRVHNVCALSPLSLDELYRILTEPRNSLVQQYTALFETYPSRLRFTQRALYAIAERASKNETGARGLKMEMERVLAEPMFDAPMAYVLITEGCVRGTDKAGYWGKDGRFEIERRIQEEDQGLPGHEAPVEKSISLSPLRQAGQSGA